MRQAKVLSVMNESGGTARDRRAEKRGLKRSLNSEDQPNPDVKDQPEPTYTVYTYIPSLCDNVLRGENNNQVQLPDVTCSGCHGTFKQKSITNYDLPDEFSDQFYADLQFHQFGALCLQCRAPFPGEGHFTWEKHHLKKTANPLTEYLVNCLGVTSLQNIVFDYYKHPEYTQLEGAHINMLMKGDEEDEGRNNSRRDLVTLYTQGPRFMSIPGVEHVYYREEVEHYNESGYESVPDIKLDYRYWRPKECKCTRTPCECICFPAQVCNIKKKLNISDTHPAKDYKILSTRNYANMNYNFDSTRMFVYMRVWLAPNPVHNPTAPSPVQRLEGRWEGVCHTKYEKNKVVTVHTAECSRRSAQYLSFKCMLNESRCGQCPDCVEKRRSRKAKKAKKARKNQWTEEGVEGKRSCTRGSIS